MRIMAFDPGLTHTGWAVRDEADYVNAGNIVPVKTGPLWVRLEDLASSVLSLLVEYNPAAIVIEWSSGHVDTNRHKGGGAQLASYGAAVATVWQEAILYRVYCDLNNTLSHQKVTIHNTDEHWCRSIPKRLRPAVAAQLFPAYAGLSDPGADMADAICLADWLFKEMQMRSANDR